MTVAAVLASLGILVVGVGVYVGDVSGTVIASIGTIFVTVALFSVLYDGFLKDVLLDEIYRALEIEQNVRAIDLREILRKDQLDLGSLLADAQSLTAIPLDPETWSRTDWQQVLECAAKQTVDVSILLPDRDSPHIDVLGQRLGIDREVLVSQIRKLPDQLARSWDEKVGGDGQSSFSVYLYGGIPAVGILTTDRIMVVEIPPALTHAATDRSTIALVFGRESTSPLMTDFVDEQLFVGGKLNPQRIPDFSRSVMRPLMPAISPDPPDPSGGAAL